MKIAIRENDLYPESQWPDWMKNFKPEDGALFITEEPYNYQMVNIPEDVEINKVRYEQFEIVGGVYFFERAKYDEEITVQTKKEIRVRRSAECFPIVNRGTVWYDRLTESQRSELAAWYQAWLDAPETEKIPERPLWLEEQ